MLQMDKNTKLLFILVPFTDKFYLGPTKEKINEGSYSTIAKNYLYTFVNTC